MGQGRLKKKEDKVINEALRFDNKMGKQGPHNLVMESYVNENYVIVIVDV